MLRNYFKIAFRNLLKNKVYSILNISGLALGMAACFFIFQYVHFEKSYDHFNKNIDNLYRVTLKFTGSFDNVALSATNHPAVGPAMKAEFPEVKDFTRLVNIAQIANQATISRNEPGMPVKTYNEQGYFVADKSFFNMFSYPLLKGNSATCLAEANSLVISASAADRFFGKEDPIGKTLYYNGRAPLKVTGVFKDVMDNSHIHFNMLMSFSTIGENWGYTEWTYPEFYNYVLLEPGTDPKKIEARFPDFILKHMGAKMKELNYGAKFFLQPVKDIHLQSNIAKEAETNGSAREVAFLSIIGVFILLIAWINYVNLSTAKSMERAREVGLRKVVGAAKTQLITQFLFESLLINVIALVLACAIVIVAMPFFRDFLGKDIAAGFFTTGLGAEPMFWIVFLTLFIAGALLVGLYPSLVLSSFRPTSVLKGLFVKPAMGISLRRVLVSFQFILSIILIAGTLIVSKQLLFMRNGDLGYDKDQVLVIKTPGIRDSTIESKVSYFKSESLKIPVVNNISITSDIPGEIIRYRNSVRKESEDNKSNFTSSLIEIDYKFVPTYGINLLAGRNFKEGEYLDYGNQTGRVLINEVLMNALGYKTPEDAINKRIVFDLGEFKLHCEIIGVMKNFHQRSFKEPIEPILCYQPQYGAWKYFSVNMRASDITNNLAALEKLYITTFPGNPFDYAFLDDRFNAQYKEDLRLGKIFGLFCILAVIVACLGLLGLTSYVIRLRTKEIGIRKVLGASVGSIMILFSKDFVRLVVVASLIAIPVVYFAADKWLANYAFHINLNWIIFIIPVLLLLGIALLTISLQTLKAALSNPVRSLRSE
jgi:putative ABC transport system permease protein